MKSCHESDLRLRVLDQVGVREPCVQPWDEMTGDDRQRFCDRCCKHVHHLGAMTTSEAQALLAQSPGNLCIRFRRDASGRIVTKDRKPTRRNWLVRAAGFLVGALGLTLVGCEEELQPGDIAGNMVWPEPAAKKPKETEEIERAKREGR